MSCAYEYLIQNEVGLPSSREAWMWKCSKISLSTMGLCMYSLFPPLYWAAIDMKESVRLRRAAQGVDTRVYCGMTTRPGFLHIYQLVQLQNKCFSLWWELFGSTVSVIFSHAVVNDVTLHITSFMNTFTWFPTPQPLVPATVSLLSMSLDFFEDSTYKWEHTGFVFVWLILLNMMLSVWYLCCHK